MITLEQLDIYKKVQQEIWNIADLWHQNSFKNGRSGYTTSKPTLETWGDITFYRQMQTSGIGYYNPEKITIKGGGKYLLDDSTLIEDARKHLEDKIHKEECRIKSEQEKLNSLMFDENVKEYIRLSKGATSSPVYGVINYNLAPRESIY